VIGYLILAVSFFEFVGAEGDGAGGARAAAS
jgi:hypothetical protein